MVLSNFPNGISSFGVPVMGNGIPTGGGKYFFVDATNGNDGNDGSWNAPFATIDYAIGYCTADAGDVIVTKPGHAETVASSSAITFDVAGVTLFCLGNESERAKLTFSTATSASVVVSAANVKILGLIGVAGINALTTPITVTGSGFYGDIEWRDASTVVEALFVVRATTVTNFNLNLRHKGFSGGTGGTSAVALVAVTQARVNLDVFGKFSVSACDMLTTLSTDVEVRGTIYNASSSGANKDVTATIGSCTWFAEIWDAQAGALYAGGSGTSGTLSAADPSAIGSNVTTILAELAGAAGVASWPTAAAYANAVSIAEVLGYIQDAVRNGSGTAMPTDKSIVDVLGTGFTGAAAHTVQAALGTDGTTAADSAASLVGIIGSNTATTAFSSGSVVADADGNVLERLEYIQSLSGSVPATYFPSVGYKVSKTENVNTATGVDLFTVTGKVLITMWCGEVTNAIGAAVTDYKLRVKTDNVDLCAATNIATAAIGVLFQMCGDAGDTLVNTALSVKAADTNGKGQAYRLIGLAGGSCTLQSLRTAGDSGDAIIHTIWYMPLEAGATVVAA